MRSARSHGDARTSSPIQQRPAAHPGVSAEAHQSAGLPALCVPGGLEDEIARSETEIEIVRSLLREDRPRADGRRRCERADGEFRRPHTVGARNHGVRDNVTLVENY